MKRVILLAVCASLGMQAQTIVTISATDPVIATSIPGINANFAALKAFDLTVAVVGLTGAYSDLTGKPSLFSGAWTDLSGKPSTFPPSLRAPSTLGGVESIDCTGLGHLLAISTAGVPLCSADAGGSSRSYNFQGITQAGVNAWNLNYQTLTNGAYTATDGAHLRSTLVVTANTTLLGNTPANSLGAWTVTPVASTNPSVHFVVEARSSDQTHAGSMALSYACVVAGSNVDNPTPIALTALALTSISATKSIYESTQTVTCTGTADAPSDLYVWWTPTAPSGGTLTNLRWALAY